MSRSDPGAPIEMASHSSTAKENDSEKELDTTEPVDDESPATNKHHESLPYNWDKPETAVQHISYKVLFRKNWHPTIVFCGVFWSFGMCVAFLGPTLLDLGCQTSSDMSRISWVFFFQLCFTLIGSVIAGFLVQRANANIVILVACSLIPILMFTIPFCQDLAALGVVLCLMGLNMGAIDCLANVQMIRLYGEAVSPFLQAMHFCYGLGAFVSPLIAEPFLLNEDCSEFIDHPTTVSNGHHGNHTGASVTDPLEEAKEETEVKFSFWIMCVLQLPIPILVMSLLYRERYLGQTFEAETNDRSVDNGHAPKPEYGTMNKNKDPIASTLTKPQYKHYNRYKLCGTAKSQLYAIVIFTAILLFIFDGLQSEYGGFIYSYAVKSIVDLNKTEGAYLNAVYWGMFALGRLVAIPIATVVSSACMLFTNVVGCVLSMILMLCLRHYRIALYFGTCLFGLFVSSSTPTALALAEQYIDMSSSITTLLVVSAALGDMLSPVIVAYLFVHIGPWSFLQFGLAFSIIALFFYLLLVGTGSQTLKHQAKKPTSSFFTCDLCCVRGGVEMDDDPPTHVKYYTRMSESESTVDIGGNASSVPNGNTH